ncbi:hypothetical protein JTE90_001541 [Oedothorax gibbosus]|uniref:Uncharacterized protein n=1 Tax=Oedothorax gibbosus TaxID=931172 RepID=A0AAV6VLU0_9ARAC|nr:hypothetical protein JTE90_001541 [Oedothorax gibbosus]
MGLTRMMLVALLLCGVILAVDAQEANFGKKVKCYIEAGTVVCPGCNSRAGLSCPRNNLKTCDNELYTTQTYEDKTEPTTAKETQFFKPTTTTDDNKIPPFSPDIAEEDIAYWAKLAQENKEFRNFLYRILNYRRPRAPRYKRQIVQQMPLEDDDTCKWNGDCPCPLICCKTGEGCPKRCMKGIRLPPPFG